MNRKANAIGIFFALIIFVAAVLVVILMMTSVVPSSATLENSYEFTTDFDVSPEDSPLEVLVDTYENQGGLCYVYEIIVDQNADYKIEYTFFHDAAQVKELTLDSMSKKKVQLVDSALLQPNKMLMSFYGSSSEDNPATEITINTYEYDCNNINFYDKWRIALHGLWN